MTEAEYDDEYPTRARPQAALLVYTGEIDPSVVADRLGIEPTSWRLRGEVGRPRRPRPPRIAPINGWFPESEGPVDSRDSRRRVDWLLDRLEPKAEAIRSPRAMGCRMEIACYWGTRSGHGGPVNPPSRMRRLVDLDSELWFDFYGPFDEEDD